MRVIVGSFFSKNFLNEVIHKRFSFLQNNFYHYSMGIKPIQKKALIIF